MSEFIAWVSRLFSSWRPWIVVPPWEIGVRVRLGKHAVALKPGPHLRLPLIDHIVNVNTRLRLTTCPPVTIGNGDSRAKLRKASAGYVVVDPLKALMRFNNPMSAVDSMLQAEVAKFGSEEECLRSARETFEPYGIKVEFVRFVEDAQVRVFRLIQSDWTVNDNGIGLGQGQRSEF